MRIGGRSAGEAVARLAEWIHGRQKKILAGGCSISIPLADGASFD